MLSHKYPKIDFPKPSQTIKHNGYTIEQWDGIAYTGGPIFHAFRPDSIYTSFASATLQKVVDWIDKDIIEE